MIHVNCTKNTNTGRKRDKQTTLITNEIPPRLEFVESFRVDAFDDERGREVTEFAFLFFFCLSNKLPVEVVRVDDVPVWGRDLDDVLLSELSLERVVADFGRAENEIGEQI